MDRRFRSFELADAFAKTAAPSVLCALLLPACGGVSDGTSRTEGPREEEAAVTRPEDVVVQVDLERRYQTLEGFGASVAWYVEWLAEHPNDEELYDLLFVELGADIVRFRNTFQRGNSRERFAPGEQSIVEGANARRETPIQVLISSWSPPPSLKDNQSTHCDNLCSANGGAAGCVPAQCTLAQNEEGEFVYDEFAAYWLESLEAYAELGIEPSWISIQNEPDFTPSGWEGCRFAPSEDNGIASYGHALRATAERIAELENPPGLLGPETLGVHRDRVLEYADAIEQGELYGIAHHLYEGEAWQDPDSYEPWLRKIRSNYGDELPVFQTEFGEGGGFETAWLIHTALVEANAAAYLYWELIWAGKGLISLDNPFDEDNFTQPGYEIQPQFYAMQHYARFTDPGYVRVGADLSSDALRGSAFLSPGEDRLVLVLLNPEADAQPLSWELGDFGAADVRAFLTVEDEPFEPVTDFSLEDEFELPARGILTLVAER